MESQLLNVCCRICLVDKKVQLVKFDAVNFVFQQESESEQEEVSLTSCLKSLGIQIPVNQVKASKICIVCLREAEIAGKFKYKARESEKKIQERLSGNYSKRKSVFEDNVAGKRLKNIEIVSLPNIPEETFIKMEPGTEFHEITDQNVLLGSISNFEKNIQNQFEMTKSFIRAMFQEHIQSKAVNFREDVNNEVKEIPNRNRKQEVYNLRPTASTNVTFQEDSSENEEEGNDTDEDYIDSEEKEIAIAVSDIKVENYEIQSIDGAGTSTTTKALELKQFNRKLPFKDKQDFIDFEHNVQSSEEYQKLWISFINQMKKHISYMKGLDPLIKTIFTKLMTEEVMFNFTFSGFSTTKYENIAVKNYKTIEILVECLLEFYPHIDQEHIEKRIASRLRDTKNIVKHRRLKAEKNATEQKESSVKGKRKSKKVESEFSDEDESVQFVKRESVTKENHNNEDKGSEEEEENESTNDMDTDLNESSLLEDPNIEENQNSLNELSAKEKCSVLRTQMVRKKLIDPAGDFSKSFFPILDKENFLRFEEGLCLNPDWSNQLVQYLRDNHKRQPHVACRKFMRTALRRVVKDSAACHFTWTGNQGNCRLQGMEFTGILENVTLELYPKSTYQDVQKVIKTFFRDAKGLVGLKVRNMKTPQQDHIKPIETNPERAEKLKVIMDLMVKLLSRPILYDNSIRPEGFPETSEFPLTDKDKFVEFEVALRQKEDWQDFVKQFLISSRTKKEKESYECFIRNSFLKLLHCIVGHQFTWNGRHVSEEKQKELQGVYRFNAFKITEIIQEATTELFPSISRELIDKESRNFVSNYKARYCVQLRNYETRLDSQNLEQFME